jgi:hypothetical protein
MPSDRGIAHEDISFEDRRKLSGLLGFAQGVLNARSKVQMAMQMGLGVFHEGEVDGLPGLHFNCEDGAWLRIDRQRETRPPEPNKQRWWSCGCVEAPYKSITTGPAVILVLWRGL